MSYRWCNVAHYFSCLSNNHKNSKSESVQIKAHPSRGVDAIRTAQKIRKELFAEGAPKDRVSSLFYNDCVI